MKSPVYGSDFIAKFLTPAYVKVHTTAVTRPATAAAALLLLEGTKGGGTITAIAATGAAIDGKFFYIPTPSNVIGVYFSENTTASPPSGMSCDVYIEVIVLTADVTADIATKLYNKLSLNKEIEITGFTNPAMTYECVQGGVCDVPSEPDAAAYVAISATAAGVGEWAKLGKLANDLGLEPSPNEVEDSELGSIVINVGYELAMNLMNTDQRNRENLYSYFNKRSCDVAFFNPTDPKSPMLVIQEIPLSMFDAPFGDTYQMQCKGKKTYTSPENYIKLWTYNNQLS